MNYKKRRASINNPRSRARVFALQGLYQYLILGDEDIESIDIFTRNLSGFHKADVSHYESIFYGCIKQRKYLDTLMQPALDRPIKMLTPIEHCVIWMGLFELDNCLDVPWRVVLNEYIELGKNFGGTDAHKFINSILNFLACELRPEIKNSTIKEQA